MSLSFAPLGLCIVASVAVINPACCIWLGSDLVLLVCAYGRRCDSDGPVSIILFFASFASLLATSIVVKTEAVTAVAYMVLGMVQ